MEGKNKLSLARVWVGDKVGIYTLKLGFSGVFRDLWMFPRV